MHNLKLEVSYITGFTLYTFRGQWYLWVYDVLLAQQQLDQFIIFWYTSWYQSIVSGSAGYAVISYTIGKDIQLEVETGKNKFSTWNFIQRKSQPLLHLCIISQEKRLADLKAKHSNRLSSLCNGNANTMGNFDDQLHLQVSGLLCCDQ